MENNPYRTQEFNADTSYDINPTGNRLVVKPYMINKVKDESFVEKPLYKNKFIDMNVHQFNQDPITLLPDDLETLRRKAIDRVRKKGNVFTEVKLTYVNISSAQRPLFPVNVYEKDYRQLPPYPLEFTNGSKNLIVHDPGHTYSVNDNVILANVVSKNLVLNNPLMVKKNSIYMRVYQPGHGISLYGLFDPLAVDQFTPIDYVAPLPSSYTETQNIPDGNTQYYILTINNTIDLFNRFSNIKGSDFTRTFIGNIPINSLNKKQRIYLIYTKVGNEFVSDPDSYLIQLAIPSAINYQDGINYVKNQNGTFTTTLATNRVLDVYNNLFGVPLNYINTGTPINQDRKYQYFTITATTTNTFTVLMNYPAVVDPVNSFYNYTDNLDQEFTNILVGNSMGGGGQCLVRKISNIIEGYPNPNKYSVILDRTYINVIQIRIVASQFPNSQKIVTNDIANNRIYWRDLDATQIYYIEVTPGNYSPRELSRELDKKFNQMIRYRYTTQFLNGTSPGIVGEIDLTPINQLDYDENGYYKYHIIRTDIDPLTDIVTFAAYRRLVAQDRLNEYEVLVIPSYHIQFTQAANLMSAIDLNNLFPSLMMNAFNPIDEILFIFFTSNSHLLINQTFPYMYGNLYQYVKAVETTDPTAPGFITYSAVLNYNRALLVNFYRNKGVYGGSNISEKELNSINTTTLLDQNFAFNGITSNVYFPNHQLKVGDLIITDQFISPNTPTDIFVYEITQVVDEDNFIVIRYNHGTKYKFIYDSILINFATAQSASYPTVTNAYQYLDQITSPPAIASSSFSFVYVDQVSSDNRIMRIRQPSHNLTIGDKITLSDSGSINQVPSNAINRTFIITKIIDTDHYQVELGQYLPLGNSANDIQLDLNTVTIEYPDYFQMFFNFDDTLGNLLSFQKVGQSIAITPFLYVIKNTTPYEDDYTYETLGIEYVEKLKKLHMTGDFYFYITSPQLASSTYRNTEPVTNVFARIRWFDDPGFVSFDSFEPVITVFDNPIPNLSQFSLEMVRPNGKLVDFNGLDHTFTIEITEGFNEPDETNIDTKTNSEQITRFVNQ